MSDDRPADQTSPAPRRRGLDGRTIGGRYRVLRTVAAGANTLIADAHDTELDRTVTIKLVRPELSESEAFRRTFRKRMDEMATISHPNLAAVYDWGEDFSGAASSFLAARPLVAELGRAAWLGDRAPVERGCSLSSL